jgi:Metallo-beta-lactamase superfamily
MTELSRRHILTGAAAAAAIVPFAAPSAHAAAPLSGKQAPSFYRSKLGDFEITVVSDGARAIPLPATFVRNISNEQVLAAAEAAYMPKGSIIAPFNPIVVNTGAKLVLIDTGYGPGLGPTVGLLPLTLAAAGIDPKAVDIVLISHMHGDHILGLKTPDGALAFPNAEIKVVHKDVVRVQSQDFFQPRGQGDAIRLGPGGRSRHHRGRIQRPHARPHLVRHRVGIGPAVLPGRRHQRAGAVPAQSRLAGDVRP